MDKKDWFSTEKLKGISKNHLLIGGLVGVLLLVIALRMDRYVCDLRQGSP